MPKYLRERLAWFRRRLKQKDEPARVWVRRHWRSFALLFIACAGIITFDAWLGTCGFNIGYGGLSYHVGNIHRLAFYRHAQDQ